MTVTVRIDSDLREKPYWAKTQDSQVFTYLRDREGGIAMLKDGSGRVVSCAKERVIFPSLDPVVALVEAAIVPSPDTALSECIDALDKMKKQEDNSTKEN